MRGAQIGLNAVAETESQEGIEIGAEIEIAAGTEIVAHDVIEAEEILETVATEGPTEALIETALVPRETAIAVDAKKAVVMIAMIEVSLVGKIAPIEIEKIDSHVESLTIEALVMIFQMT